jgi:predicted PurR-regulated permease PerM
MTGFPKEKVKQAYFLVALTALACLLAFYLREYISSFLGAATIFILVRRPLYYFTEKKSKWRKLLVVITLMLMSLVLLVLPITLISFMLSSKVQYVLQHYASLLQSVKEWNDRISQRFGMNVLSNDTLGKITTAGANIIPKILSTTLSSVMQLLIMFLVLYFMLMDGRRLEKWIRDNAPFHRENTNLLTQELKTQTLANAIGIPVMGVAQGVCSGIGYWIFGVDQPLFWAVVTGFASVMPVVGTAIVWIPVTIYMIIAGGPHWHGIGVGIYSAIVLVNVDNLVRMPLLRWLGDTLWV